MSTENNTIEIFSSRLAALMEKHGVTQTQLAKGTSLAQSAISNYQGGKRLPPLEEALRIARFFKRSLMHFLPDEEQCATVPRSEMEEWRRRAIVAEAAIEEITGQLRHFIDARSEGAAFEAKTMVEVVGQVADHLLAKGIDPSKLPPPGQKSRRPSSTSRSTSSAHPSPSTRDREN